MSNSRRFQKLGLELSILAAAYALLAKIVLMHFSETGNVTLVWFSGGLGLAILLLQGLQYWPGIFVGAFAAGLMVDDSFSLSLLLACGNTLESVCAAWCLQRWSRFSIEMARPRHFVSITLVAAACSCISALIGPMAIWWGGLLPIAALPKAMLYWWMADVFGIVLVTPLLLIWRRWPGDWFEQHFGLEALLFMGLTILAGSVVFLDVFQGALGGFTRGYWMFALMM